MTLTNAAKQFCTITTPFGEYKYNCLSMGVCIVPDVFQDLMSCLFDDLEAVRVYIDNLLIVTSSTFKEHLLEVNKVMQKLEKKELKCKISKCEFAVPEKEYLGYIIIREGVWIPKKYKQFSILNVLWKKKRQFLGMVQYYCDVWPKRNKILSPLTELMKVTKNGPIKWIPE